MKKFLSLVLALALVLSALSIVTFAEAEPVGYKLTSSKDDCTNYVKGNAGVISSLADGTYTITQKVYNPSTTKTVKVQICLQATVKNTADRDTWAGPQSPETTIAPNSVEEVTLTFTVASGCINVAAAKTPATAIAGFFYRVNVFDVAAGSTGLDKDEYIVIGYSATNTTLNKQLADTLPTSSTSTYAASKVTELPNIQPKTKDYGVKDGVYTNDFEKEDPTANSIGAYTVKYERSTEYAKDGSYSLKVSAGTADYMSPKLTTAAVKAVTNGVAGMYVFEADYYFTTLPALTTVLLNSRITGSLYNNKLVADYTTNNTNITTGKWIHITMVIDLTKAWVDDPAIDLAFGEQMGNGGVYYVDNIRFAKFTAPSGSPSTSPSTEPTKAPEYKKVVNGDAESGTTNWDIFKTVGKGTVTQVAPGANDTAHAIKYDPAGGGAYSSIAFDLGPAIIKDTDNLYNGAGEGEYTVKFWAKADKDCEGDFNMVLNSQCHLGTSNFDKAPYDTISDYARNTYLISSKISLTDEWEEYEVVFNVTEDFLETLYQLYNTVDKKEAYELILRFDGAAAGLGYNEERFSYFVDEVTIEAPETEDGGEEEVKTPVGVKFTLNGENSTDCYFVGNTAGGALTAADVKNGVVSKTFKVKNNGEEDIQVALYFQALLHASEKATWKGPVENNYVTIAAGDTEEITIEIEVEEGKVVVPGTDEEEVDLSKFFWRLNVKSGEGSNTFENASFSIFCTDKDYTNLLALKRTGWTVETEYSAPTNTGDVLPVVAIVLASVAFVALAVVVIRKKREQF